MRESKSPHVGSYSGPARQDWYSADSVGYEASLVNPYFPPALGERAH